MALKGNKGFSFSALLFWRLAIVFFSVLCLALMVHVWLKAGDETADAFASGRRLMFRLDDGTIEGKQITYSGGKEVQKAAAKPDGDPASASAEEKPEDGKAPDTKADAEKPADAPAKAVDTALINPSATPPVGANPALLEKTDQGYIPVSGKDGTKPWRFYAKPYTFKGSMPMVAIVVTGLGQSREVTDAALRLPENVTLSFSSYARDVESWFTGARQAGHELMLDLPLEPANFPAVDPGPYALYSSRDFEEQAARLQWVMARAGGYIGFSTQHNEVFSQYENAFKALLKTLNTRGLVLLLSREPAQTSTRDMLEAKGSLAIISDIWLDEDLSPVTMQARLSSLEQLALKRGYAVGIARAYPLSVEQLKLWSARLADKGVVLVPLSAIMRVKTS